VAELMIIYNFYINFYKDDLIITELGRMNSISSDIMLLKEGMEIAIDGMVLTIEKIFINLEIEPEDICSLSEDIEFDVFLIGGDRSNGCINAGMLVQRGWYCVDGEVEEFRKLEEHERVASMDNVKMIFRQVKRKSMLEDELKRHEDELKQYEKMKDLSK
jgi:hypothetical protein